jgi:hypothetical protein
LATAESLDLAAEFEVATDGVIIEDAEAIYDGDGAPGHFDQFIGVEVAVRGLNFVEVCLLALFRPAFLSQFKTLSFPSLAHFL